MTARHSWMLHAGTLEASQAEALPALTLCVEALTSLPLQLQRAIGIDLRVPSSVMATAMPPGASYKAHLDSHGGVDNPRILTCLLYLGYDPPSGGALRMLKGGALGDGEGGHRGGQDGAGGQGGAGRHRDILPLPGRLCVFFAQEMEHEVRPSSGTRLALQLWIWQKQRDSSGR